MCGIIRRSIVRVYAQRACAPFSVRRARLIICSSSIHLEPMLGPCRALVSKVNICIGTLTALVLFHVSLANQLPSASTSTFADYVMICAYSLNFLTWIIAIMLMLMAHAEVEPKWSLLLLLLFLLVVFCSWFGNLWVQLQTLKGGRTRSVPAWVFGPLVHVTGHVLGLFEMHA
jgi:hypothetical protein